MHRACGNLQNEPYLCRNKRWHWEIQSCRKSTRIALTGGRYQMQMFSHRTIMNLWPEGVIKYKVSGDSCYVSVGCVQAGFYQLCCLSVFKVGKQKRHTHLSICLSLTLSRWTVYPHSLKVRSLNLCVMFIVDTFSISCYLTATSHTFHCL